MTELGGVGLALRFGGGGGWGDGGLFGAAAAEDGGAALALAGGDVVDLVPEADEVIDCGDDGDDGHPVHGGDGDEVDADGEAPEVPVVPTVMEGDGNDGDDLDDGFEFAEVGGFDGKAFRGRDGAEAAHEELAAYDEDGDPGVHDAGVVGDEKDEGRGDHELVGEGVEEHAEGGDLAAAAGEVAVKAVGDGGEDENAGGDEFLLGPGEEAVDGKMEACGQMKVRRERPDEDRDACDAGERDGVG